MLLGRSGGQGELSLGVRVFLRDQFSGPTRQMTRALKGYRREFLAFQENLRIARNFSAMAAAGAGALMLGLSNAIQEGAQFLYVMRGVEAITEASADAMDRLSAQAIKLGRQTMFTPYQVSSGMRFMAMAGQTAKQIKESMPAATYLAGATMTALGGKMGAADILTNALKAFGKPAKDSMMMANLLTTAATSANVSLVDLGNSIRYVAATTRNLDVPVREVVANLMALGNAGIQSSMAGTALENAYRYLANSLSETATAKSRRAWARLGLTKAQLTDTYGNLLPLVDVLQKIKTHMAGMSSLDIQNTLKDIFGVRGQRAAATLLRNLEQVTQFEEKLAIGEKSGSAFQKTQLMMNSLEGNILKFTSAIQGLKAAFAKSVEPYVSKLLKGLTAIVGWISDFVSTPIGGFFAKVFLTVTALSTVLAGLVLAVTSATYAFRSLTTTFKSMVASVQFAAFGRLGRASSIAVGRQAYMWGATVPSYVKGLSVTRAPSTGPATYNPVANRWMSGGKFVAMPYAATNLKGKQLQVLGMTRVIKNTSKLGTMVSKLGFLGKLGGGFLSFLSGPWGLAIMAVSTFLPLIIDAFSSNTSAVKENTEVLKQARGKTNMQDFWLMTRGMSVEQITGLIIDRLDALVRINQENLNAFQTALDNEDYSTLLNLMSGGNMSSSNYGFDDK